MKSYFILLTIILTALYLTSCKASTNKEIENNRKQLDTVVSVSRKDTNIKLDTFNWAGEYSYVLKKGQGQTWNYNLKIRKEQNTYRAVFDVLGYQTAYPMNCSVLKDGNRIKIYFDKFHNDPSVNNYKEGDLLVELENTGKDILTYWHKAIILDNQKSGVVAFRKAKGDSFLFMKRHVVFGSSIENYLSVFTEFKENNELSNNSERVVSLTTILADCKIDYNVYFGDIGLIKFEMISYCSHMEDEEIIQSITKQFKLIPQKEIDDEEMPIGDIIEIYEKGKLKAEEFIGGFYKLTIYTEQ